MSRGDFVVIVSFCEEAADGKMPKKKTIAKILLKLLVGHRCNLVFIGFDSRLQAGAANLPIQLKTAVI